MSLLIFIYFAFTIPVSADPILPTNKPADLIIMIYGKLKSSDNAKEWHAADKKYRIGASDDEIPKFNQLPLSTELRSLYSKAMVLEKKYDKGCLDYDPMTDSQDPQVDRYKFELRKIKTDEMVVDVRLISWGKKRTFPIQYKLKKENEKWYVDDIISFYENQKSNDPSIKENSVKKLIKLECLKAVL